jgi:ribosomal protein S18 acetylase RimI-like enzyme
MERQSLVIERVRTITPEIVKAFERLIPQLTSNNPAPELADLNALVGTDTNVLLVARQGDTTGEIVGAGALAVYRVPTGVRAVIEDVVVDAAARGKGIGEALLGSLLALAQEMGAPGVSLTSNPARAAANRLYIRMGFALRETNCYYYRFPQ